MFTGIIEALGEINLIQQEGSNIHFTIKSPISKHLKIDQSVSHNGVCLTVVKCDENSHTVTAIQETLDKTSLGNWELGKTVNLERCMLANGRFDGHIVQGHVDCTATCEERIDKNGSWEYQFSHPQSSNFITVEKGSICINGVSLTVFNSTPTGFRVAIIPYTFEHTTFKNLFPYDKVNLEFDILGKYVARMLGK